MDWRHPFGCEDFGPADPPVTLGAVGGASLGEVAALTPPECLCAEPELIQAVAVGEELRLVCPSADIAREVEAGRPRLQRPFADQAANLREAAPSGWIWRQDCVGRWGLEPADLPEADRWWARWTWNQLAEATQDVFSLQPAFRLGTLEKQTHQEPSGRVPVGPDEV